MWGKIKGKRFGAVMVVVRLLTNCLQDPDRERFLANLDTSSVSHRRAQDMKMSEPESNDLDGTRLALDSFSVVNVCNRECLIGNIMMGSSSDFDGSPDLWTGSGLWSRPDSLFEFCPTLSSESFRGRILASVPV